MFYYEVIASLKDQQAQMDYVAWLKGGHASALLQWAERAEVVVLDHEDDDSVWRVKSMYLFQSRTAYELYVKEGAPRLRAEGVVLAIQLGGITFERSLGEVWSCEPLG